MMPAKIAASNFQSSASRLTTKEAVVIGLPPAAGLEGCMWKQSSRLSPLSPHRSMTSETHRRAASPIRTRLGRWPSYGLLG